MDAANIHSSSHRGRWKGFSQTLPLFLRYTKLSLGWGNKIRFWLDPWVDSYPFSSRFPRPFNLSSLKTEVISSFYSPSSNWDSIFIGILGTLKLINFLPSLILFIIPVSPPCSGCRLWSLSSSSLFFVSFFFSTISLPLSLCLPQRDLGSSYPFQSTGLSLKNAWNRAPPTLEVVPSFNPNLTLLPKLAPCLSAAGTTYGLFIHS